VIESRDDLRRYLADDLAMNGLPPRWSRRYRLTRRTVYYQRLLRRSEYWANCRADWLGRGVLSVLKARVILLGERLGVEIPRNVFGPGLSIAHAGSLVVNGDTVVGARCRIHQGVTLAGASDGAPVIGDDVFIGPNVVVVGRVMIGRGAVVLAGSVVTDDVPAHSMVAGVPAGVVGNEAQMWHESIFPLPAHPPAGRHDASRSAASNRS
jgi:serine O-acetyltransferase